MFENRCRYLQICNVHVLSLMCKSLNNVTLFICTHATSSDPLHFGHASTWLPPPAGNECTRMRMHTRLMWNGASASALYIACANSV